MKKSKDLKNPKEQFFKLAEANKAQEFFQKNYTEIKYTVIVYELLQNIYKSDRDIIEDKYFQSCFGQFYAMTKFFASEKFINDLFLEMDKIRKMKNTNNLNIIAITNKLCQGENEKDKKLQFSFISKMLNLENDELYPIYDSKVTYEFSFGSRLPKDREERLVELERRYQEIIKVYNELLQEETTANILLFFRETFSCFDMTGMRILDIIFWQLGKWDEKYDKMNHQQ